MPTNKPERWEIQRAYDSVATYHGAISAVAALVNERWQADEAERERGRKALEVALSYAQHRNYCNLSTSDDCRMGAGCACGLHRLLTQLWDDPPHPPSATTDPEARKPAEWEYAAGDTAAPGEHDVDAFNREQRVRRDAYAQGLEHGGYTVTSASNLAADRYPLKKREPRIIPDPHGKGEWCFVRPADRFYPYWRHDSKWIEQQAYGYVFPTLDGDRIRALAGLLDSPFTYVDDTTPEQEST